MRIVPDNPEQAVQEKEPSLALENEYSATSRGNIDNVHATTSKCDEGLNKNI